MSILSLVLIGVVAIVCVITLALTFMSWTSSKMATQELSAMLARSSAELSADIRQKLSDLVLHNFSLVTKEVRDGLQQTTTGLEAKFTALEGRVSQRLETIGKEVQTKLDKNLQDGFSQFQKIQELLQGAEKQLLGLNNIGGSIQELNNVLNLPHLRGKIIGEGTLERLLSDFLPAGFYATQYPIDGALVDAVIKFPHLNLVLPIDSKFSMEQVSALFEVAGDPEKLKLARKKLYDVTRANARDIKTKYIKPASGTTDYALMYLPSETLYFEIIRDTELWAAIAEQKVFPVSPNTLAITINSIGKSLHYYKLGQGVQKTIVQIQTAQNHLNNFKNRFDDIGEKLTKAQDSFHKATTHFGYFSSSVERLTSTAQLDEADAKKTDSPPPLLGV